MCGIAGIIGLSSAARIESSLIVEMCDRIAHRGPDGEGFLFTDQVQEGFVTRVKQDRMEALVLLETFHRPMVLGHRRLAIIDLHDSAAQPMSTISRRYWITTEIRPILYF